MRPLFILFVVGMLACIGCNRLELRSRSADLSTDATNSANPPISESAPNSSTLATKPASLNCIKDKNGNALKVIVSNHHAAMYSDSTGSELIRRCPMMERSYLFGSERNRHHVGANPRLKGEGWLDSNDAYLTSNMQFVQFNAESRVIREVVTAFSSVDDLEGFLNGRPVKPSLVESKLGNSSADSWMPILDSRIINVGTAKVRVMELGAWTLSQTSARSKPASKATAVHKQGRMNKEELQNTMNQYRIVLCIDATSSMHTIWNTMAKRIREIMRKSVADSALTVEIALVAYRDNDPDSTWPNKASPFTNDLTKLEKWFSAMTPKGGGDWEEQVFEGLLVAAEMLARPEHAKAYKSILLVGDNAGKVDSHDPVIGSVGERLLNLCTKHGISIFSLKMPYHPEFSGDKELFPKQLQVLVDKTSGSRFEISDKSKNELESTDAIVSALLKSKEEAFVEAKIATAINDGAQLKEISDRTGLPEAALMWKIENIHRRTEGRLKLDDNMNLGVDRVWAIHDPRAFNTGVLIPIYDIELLINVLDRLITLSADKPTALAELWGQLASQSLGEDVPLSEALRVESTLPVRDNLLSITLSELIVMPRTQRKAWAAEVEKKFNALVAWKSANKPENGNYIVPTAVLP